MRVRRGYDSSPFPSYYNLMSTKYILPVQFSLLSFLFFLSSSQEHRFLSLPFFFSTPGAALEEEEEILLFFFFHYITHTFFPNSRDATIIVYPIFFLAIFIFLEERSHLVFRLLYNWKMMRWQMHIYVRGHPQIDRRGRIRRRGRRRIYRWCCHLQKEKR